MNIQQIIFGLCSATLCLSMMACGGDQKRTKIGDRSGARSQLKNSKLLKAENIVLDCSSNSEDKNKSKKILSLGGLAKSLTTSDAVGMFASSFTNRIRITDSNNNDLKNKQLTQTFLMKNGLQHNSDTLSALAPSLLKIVYENCTEVGIPISLNDENPSLFFQMARLNQEKLSQFVQKVDSFSERIESPELNAKAVGDADDAPIEQAQPKDAITFKIDLQASSEKILVLINPDNSGRIIVKVLGDETIQVSTESKNQKLEACGKSYTFDLRNEATLVWGKAQQQPVSIDFELYDNMLDLANNPELLSNGKTTDTDGRRAKGSSVQTVSLPEQFIGEFDKSLKLYRDGKQKNPFDIQPVNCSDGPETAEPAEGEDTGQNTDPEDKADSGDSSGEKESGDDKKETPDWDTTEV